MVEIGTIKTSLSYEKSVVRVVAKMLIDAPCEKLFEWNNYYQPWPTFSNMI